MILKFFFQKKYIALTYIIFNIQYALAYELKYYQNNIYLSPKTYLITNNHNYCSKNSPIVIYAESNTIEIHYPEKIQLFGNVYIKHYNNIIQSDVLTILNYKNNNIFNPILLDAKGNVRYYNKNITLTGSYAQWNLNNKNIDLHKGTYYLNKFHIYGTATHIMQRNNNHYTIIKNGNLIGCKNKHNSWNITGSNILYDQNENYMHIWNAYLKIKTIPIFYSPYISFYLNQNNTLDLYIPTITYNNKYGLTIKFPFPLIFSRYYSGNIIPYYTSKFGTGLQINMHYLNTLKTGLISLNIIKNYKHNYNYNNRIFYKLYWQHNNIINKKWHLNIDWTNHNKLHYYSNNINKKHFHNTNCYYIDQKFLFYYNNKHWKTSITYLNNSYFCKKQHIVQNYCTYAATPQLEIWFYSNPIYNKKLYFQTFGQISQFIPSNYLYPETTRIHITPIINFNENNHWLKFNIDAKLYITHYTQKNINFYNIKQHPQFPLKNKINRIIPQIKTNSTITLQKKTNSINPHKYFLESKLQYLYIPNVFQENIGIYDSKKTYINYNNLFYGMKYNGIDRIQSSNQFIGNITIHHFNKQTKFFCLSIGQILNFKKNNNFTNQIKNTKIHPYKSIINSNTQFFSLVKGSWNINNHWDVYAEVQYDTMFHKLYSANSILEYIGEKKQTFQLNYRYISTELLQNILLSSNNSIYHKSISQIGFIIHYPITKNWTINYLYYHNIKLNASITQSANIQYSTPCYTFNLTFERNINNWHNKLHINPYDNKIQLNFKLSCPKLNFQSNSCKLFQHNMIPYQNIR